MRRRRFLGLGGVMLAGGLATARRAARAAGAKVRVAVVGHTGRGDYGHGLDTMWKRIATCEIVAVADADARGLSAARARLGVERGYADYREMLKATRPDVVAVCPRHIDQHRDMVLAAVEAGARGIYMEKPFCRTPAEADEILAALKRGGVKLGLAHRNRYHPALPVVAKLLADDAIGRLLEIRGRGKEDERGGGEDLWVLGSHVLNLAQFFAGDPRGCSSWIEQGGAPVSRAHVADGKEGLGPLAGDALHARYDMACGIPFFFDSLRGAAKRGTNFGLRIFGSEGMIDVKIDRQPLAQLMRGNPYLPVATPLLWEPITAAGVGKPEPDPAGIEELEKQVLAGRDLLEAIGEGREPLCDARQGAMTVEMISAVFESHRLGGRRVGFPLETRANPLSLL